jgi:hypothetical protein
MRSSDFAALHHLAARESAELWGCAILRTLVNTRLMQKRIRKSVLADQLGKIIGHILSEVQRRGRYRRYCCRALGYTGNMRKMLVPGPRRGPSQGNGDGLPVVYLRSG